MQTATHGCQSQSLFHGLRFELHFELLQQVADGEYPDLGFQRSCIQPRNIQQGVEDVFDRLQRSIDIPRQMLKFAGRPAFDEAGR